MEPTFTKTNRSPIMMRCLGSGCNVFLVSGSNVVSGGTPVSEELDELIEMARTIRMMAAVESQVSKGARRGAPAAQLCLRQRQDRE
jgi:hypothetical protein